jgi:hypothetical protein
MSQGTRGSADYYTSSISGRTFWKFRDHSITFLEAMESTGYSRESLATFKDQFKDTLVRRFEKKRLGENWMGPRVRKSLSTAKCSQNEQTEARKPPGCYPHITQTGDVRRNRCETEHALGRKCE